MMFLALFKIEVFHFPLIWLMRFPRGQAPLQALPSDMLGFPSMEGMSCS